MNYDSIREKDDYLRGKRICEKEGGIESVTIYLDTFARFIEIPEAYIDSVINTLGTIYPDCICNHYKKYIVGVQKQAAKFLKEQS